MGHILRDLSNHFESAVQDASVHLPLSADLSVLTGTGMFPFYIERLVLDFNLLTRPGCLLESF